MDMRSHLIHGIAGLAALLIMLVTLSVWLGSANTRAEAVRAEADNPTGVAVAAAADEGYCTTDLRKILRRVLTSCGIAKEAGGRGCRPLEAQSVASMSGADFNALFKPMASRAAIIQFDKDDASLDDAGRALIDNSFADRRGASYFLIVSRSSPEGSVTHNRELSERRAAALYDHLKETYKDPDLDQVAGMLWLGEEFAQLEDEFCFWRRSRPDVECTGPELNRSAFVAWIDCRL
jgi:outer membrane protein OmpA-like peptidoglycan-associated protein